jgi:hypothetical protein
MAAQGWWDVHRQLQKGSRGGDVAALQRRLIEDSGDNFPVTSVFDAATETAVKDFQRRNELAQDGIVGPITFSVLFEGDYRFQLPHPKLMHDVEWTCWAAATESVLQSNWSRTRKSLTVADMLTTYKDFLLPTQAITFQGLDKLVKDIGAFQRIFSPKEFPLEQVLGELGRNQSPVMLIHGLYPGAAHTVVIFGVKIAKGEPWLIVMDPMDGAYEDLSVNTLRGKSNKVMRIITAHELN